MRRIVYNPKIERHVEEIVWTRTFDDIFFGLIFANGSAFMKRKLEGFVYDVSFENESGF